MGNYSLDLFDDEDDDLPEEVRQARLRDLEEERRRAELSAVLIRYFVVSISSAAEDAVIRRTIREMRKRPALLMDGQGPKNFWEEHCVRRQCDDEFACDPFRLEVLRVLEKVIEGLPKCEQLALWLTTPRGELFLDYPEGSVRTVSEVPVSVAQTADHLARALDSEALDYGNANIRSMTGR